MSYTYFVSMSRALVRSHFHILPIQIPSLCCLLKYAITYRRLALLWCNRNNFPLSSVSCCCHYATPMYIRCAHISPKIPRASTQALSHTHIQQQAYSLNEMMSHINNSIILHSCSYDGSKHLLTG